MTVTATLDTPYRNIEWSNVIDAAGPILRTAAGGAILNQPRLELSYDWERGAYELGMTAARAACDA